MPAKKTEKSKAEEIVFKNSKSEKKSENKLEKENVETQKKVAKDSNSEKAKKETSKKDSNNRKVKEETIKNNHNNEKAKEETLKNDPKSSKKDKNKNSKKIVIFLIIVLIILVVAFAFSTCFALVHATKNTIARGVSIKNIDVSNLTYSEAKSKLEEAFDIAIETNINLVYEDFSYVVTGSDIELSYELSEALTEACNIGRNGNIIENNYEVISTAIFNKDIGVEFIYSDEAVDTIVEYVAANIPNLSTQYSYYIEGEELIITPGTDGVQVDKELLKTEIIDKIQNKDLVALLNESSNDEIEIPVDEIIADEIDIESIYADVYTEPQDAYYIEETETTEFAIYEDVDGIDFAISIDEAKEIVSEEAEQYVIPLTRVEAEVTIKDIGIDAFNYQVSTFQTTYDASYTSRSTNLEIAASKINGTILMSGEQFSFNDVVGERTVSEGYQNAKIYQDGSVVDGLAGGICQVSSTLYNAVLLANLQIDERYNHSFTTSYVKAGRDATVVYGVKDLKFTNTRKYPIKIEATVANGVVTFTIYGIEEENEYEVKIIPTTTSTTAYTTQTIQDSTLAAGATIVSQAGANGCTVTTRKEVYLNGVQISNEVISNDTYQVMTRIIRVGTKN